MRISLRNNSQMETATYNHRLLPWTGTRHHRFTKMYACTTPSIGRKAAYTSLDIANETIRMIRVCFVHELMLVFSVTEETSAGIPSCRQGGLSKQRKEEKISAKGGGKQYKLIMSRFRLSHYYTLRDPCCYICISYHTRSSSIACWFWSSRFSHVLECVKVHSRLENNQSIYQEHPISSRCTRSPPWNGCP
jgi:hypothetical protein